MKITIIGWYGTETIGDRAILAGLISLFNKAYDDFEIKLGSLYPFFSERTLNEDYGFYRELIQKDINIEIFNSKNSKELTKAIKDCNLIAMGGGPLMDLDELFMVEYAFKKAKKLGKVTALLGCGVGPLFHKKYRKSVLQIVNHSDIVILRDKQSRESLEVIFKEYNHMLDLNVIHTSYDPAVECALEYKKIESDMPSQKYIAINLREFPVAYNKQHQDNDINQALENFMVLLAQKYADYEIRLIPMHYFHVGNDDREFLNTLAMEIDADNIKVQNVPLTLKETMQVYSHAYYNIGMRFHSVVLQTVLSGKNFILDYTEPKRGKISGFIDDIDKKKFFKNRYVALQEDEISIDIINDVSDKFDYSTAAIIEQLEIYMDTLKEVQV